MPHSYSFDATTNVSGSCAITIADRAGNETTVSFSVYADHISPTVYLSFFDRRSPCPNARPRPRSRCSGRRWKMAPAFAGMTWRSRSTTATLRQAFRYAMSRHPFRIDAIVILPEHLHWLWTLPIGDADFLPIGGRSGIISAAIVQSRTRGRSPDPDAGEKRRDLLRAVVFTRT